MCSLAWNAGGDSQCEGTGVNRVTAAGHAQDADQLRQFRGEEARPCAGTDTGRLQRSFRGSLPLPGGPFRAAAAQEPAEPLCLLPGGLGLSCRPPRERTEAQHRPQTRKLKFRAVGSRSRAGVWSVTGHSNPVSVSLPAYLGLLLPFFLSRYNSQNNSRN